MWEIQNVLAAHTTISLPCHEKDHDDDDQGRDGDNGGDGGDSGDDDDDGGENIDGTHYYGNTESHMFFI